MNAVVQRVWVVGAGFLGRALANACRADGVEVLTIDPTAAADVSGSAAEPAVLQQALQVLPPQKIFCCMATHGGTAEEYRLCYLDSIRCLLQCVSEAQLVFCSSVSVYGRGRGVDLTENTATMAEGKRAQVLLSAEKEVLAAGGVVARLSALYGEGRCELWRRHLCGEPQLPGSADRVLNYVHVEDAAAALLLLAQRACKGVYNVNGASFTKDAAYAQMERISGIARSTAVAPVSRRGGLVQRVASDKLRALGWKPRPFFES